MSVLDLYSAPSNLLVYLVAWWTRREQRWEGGGHGLPQFSRVQQRSGGDKLINYWNEIWTESNIVTALS